MAKKGVFGLFWPPLTCPRMGIKEGDHEVVEDFSKSYPSGAFFLIRSKMMT